TIRARSAITFRQLATRPTSAASDREGPSVARSRSRRTTSTWTTAATSTSSIARTPACISSSSRAMREELPTDCELGSFARGQPSTQRGGGAMNFIDILDRYATPPVQPSSDAPQHFEEVAHNAPPEVVSEGLADTFRAEQTPPFPDMVAPLFHHSDPQQRAGLLNQILAAVGPSVLTGGPLSELFRHFRDGTQISEHEADALLPHEVKDIAQRAQEHNPGVIERVSEFYARHPDLVRNLGNAALSIALANMARRARH